jgi:hypothetical protein
MWVWFHASSSAFASCLMVDVSSPDFRRDPIIRLTEPECPMSSLLAIQELPTLVLSRSNAASTTLRSSLFGSLAMASAVVGSPRIFTPRRTMKFTRDRNNQKPTCGSRGLLSCLGVTHLRFRPASASTPLGSPVTHTAVWMKCTTSTIAPAIPDRAGISFP